MGGDAHTRARARVVTAGRIAASVVLVVAALVWLGWATGAERLTRVLASWPPMVPWTAVLLTGLAVAILIQSGHPSRARAQIGCGLSVLAAAIAVVFLAEYMTGRSWGIDQWWFAGEVQALQRTWPGRPSPQTVASVLLLAISVGLTRRQSRWTRVVRMACLAAAALVPFVVVAAYIFHAVSILGITPSTGMALSTGLALLLLSAASFTARPDRNPLRWMLIRPDGRTLVRMVGVLAGLPIILGLSRLLFLALGVRDDGAWVLAISVSTVAVGVVMFYLSQREQRLLIDKVRISRQRVEAEARYHILADNSVDTVIHVRGMDIAWVSPSVQAALGDPPERWVGTDFASHVHPDDLDVVAASARQLAAGEAAMSRFRLRDADGCYHWIDCRSKPYVDAQGGIDGAIAALRIVDDEVETQRRLEQLAHFDILTGMVNRAEAIDRLERALQDQRVPGPCLGILFCDIDDFKAINDTWGHTAGDAVLRTIAERIRECVRAGDTLGRTGGDEMLVLLANIGGLDDALAIAEKIRWRAAEPIHHGGQTIRATLSVGATVGVPGETVTAAIARADQAMYRAKQTGRNAVVGV
jgi:diguanylate cyclase (GGDEF)-like protein/PAS domain S-box-containing protein